MAIIQDGSGNQMGVGAVSKGGFVNVLDASGNPIHSVAPAGSYILPIHVRSTAADSSGTKVWAFNTSTKTAYVRRIRGVMTFDGTASAASLLQYTFYRRVAVSAFSGGTAMTPIKKRSAYGPSTVACVYLVASGITMSSTTAETVLPVTVPGSVTGGLTQIDVLFGVGDEPYGALEIAVGDGFCMEVGGNVSQNQGSNTGNAIIGQGFRGFVEIDER